MLDELAMEVLDGLKAMLAVVEALVGAGHLVSGATQAGFVKAQCSKKQGRRERFRAFRFSGRPDLLAKDAFAVKSDPSAVEGSQGFVGSLECWEGTLSIELGINEPRSFGLQFAIVDPELDRQRPFPTFERAYKALRAFYRGRIRLHREGVFCQEIRPS